MVSSFYHFEESVLVLRLYRVVQLTSHLEALERSSGMTLSRTDFSVGLVRSVQQLRRVLLVAQCA